MSNQRYSREFKDEGFVRSSIAGTPQRGGAAISDHLYQPVSQY